MGQDREVLSLELPCDSRAPGSVRQALEQLDCVGWMMGDVMLVASELVTNAVRHSGCRPEHSVHVSACLGSDSIRISVDDPGLSGVSADIRALSDFAAGGMGLIIVDELADSWGAARDDRYRVWAELAVPQSAPV
jgi:anti-sigma regulatory factor (Ser/Thr protein kinase)